MRLWNRFRLWSRAAIRRTRTEGEMDAELGFHIAAYTADLLRKGISHEDALRRARLEFGGLERTKEECREARGVNLIEAGIQDLRFGARILRKNPGFTAIAIVTLALGIGANAGVFSVVNGVLLNPLPYPQPDRLVAIHESKPNFPEGSISFPNFKDWKKNNRTFSDMAISRRYGYSLTNAGGTERLTAQLVTSDFFRVLGVKPELGRSFAPGEDEIGAAPVVMISSSLWHRKFGGTSSIIGQMLKLNDRGYTVIGVVPASFDLIFRTADLYVPLGQWDNNALPFRSAGLSLHGFARLKPGVTLEQARADLASVTHALALEYPKDNKGVGATIKPLTQEIVGEIRPILLMLLGAVVFVLLIACVNVGNLLLARANGRRREVAIRSAVGAGAGRIIRQLLTESALLAFAGSTLGLAMAWLGTRAVLKVLPITLPRSGAIGVDYRVLGFTFVISLAAAILFGLAPALKILHLDLQNTLKDGGRGTSGGKSRTQGLFVMLEMALALVLLAGAGLMIRSLSALWGVDPGFQSNNVVNFNLSFPRSLAQLPPDAIRARLRQTQSRFAAIPGVSAVSFSWGALPMMGDDEELFWIKGQPKPISESDMNWALRYIVSSDYLKAMRIQLRRGRFFTDRDDNHSPLVVVIDEELAHKFFPNVDPIGKRLELQAPDLELQAPDGEAEIIGITGHVKQWGLDTDDKEKLRAQMYLPILQQDDGVISAIALGVNVIMRCSSSPAVAFDALRKVSTSMDSEQAVFGLQTMNEVIAGTLAERRFSMILLSAFAGLALLLAVIGVYGVTSYSVGRRTNEIGIRLAIGASRNEIFRLVLREAMRLALTGIALGVVAALLLTRLLSNLLFGVSAHDPLTLGGVAIVLAAVAAIACWIPASRAMRVDPVVALRYE